MGCRLRSLSDKSVRRRERRGGALEGVKGKKDRGRDRGRRTSCRLPTDMEARIEGATRSDSSMWCVALEPPG